MDNIYIIKADREKEIFDIEKLKDSLRRAGADEAHINEISQIIQSELKEGMTTTNIYKRAFSLLKKKDKIVASKYSVRRAIFDLGPNGFPFEDFIGEIYRQKKYKVRVGQIINGHCVIHEMDVVAQNDKEIVMVEAKFHNNTGLKSDLKTVLYVKARFDDIEDGDFYKKYGKQKPLKRFLFTNTKFSSRAVQYANCAGLNLVGWNYPIEGDNLQNLIEETGLHPLTCLNSLTKKEKGKFLNQGIVLCKDLRGGGKTILKSAGLNNRRLQEVLKEIKILCK